MTASRKSQPAHKLRVPHIIFCIGDEAALYASSLMQKNRCNYRIVVVPDRGYITAERIRQHRAELQISQTIIIPLLMAENHTLYQIMYDKKSKEIKCLDCILYEYKLVS